MLPPRRSRDFSRVSSRGMTAKRGLEPNWFFIDAPLAKLAINEAVALKNLNRFDNDLMRENPSWGRKIQSWKVEGLDLGISIEGAPFTREEVSLSL
ncbi:hypothetical protein JG688_00011808 [Phytophthora aleatoria]|uniref:Uncharacterized protein n=1 Tax=Phytophthora aleatoria TaxID=2496075 RepID=A0A8J5ILF1_9STRA|nr:hypothetical protein JG688_00011808 [Phytophthora aleatoria]